DPDAEPSTRSRDARVWRGLTCVQREMRSPHAGLADASTRMVYEEASSERRAMHQDRFTVASHSRPRRAWLGAVVLVLAILRANNAVAQSPTALEDEPTTRARALYLEGVENVQKSQWAEALFAFESSAKLRPHATTTFNVGACERALGRYARAQATL